MIQYLKVQTNPGVVPGVAKPHVIKRAKTSGAQSWKDKRDVLLGCRTCAKWGRCNTSKRNCKNQQKCNIGKSLGGSGEERWEGRVTRLLITYILCHWMQLCMQLLAPLTTLPTATSQHFPSTSLPTHACSGHAIIRFVAQPASRGN